MFSLPPVIPREPPWSLPSSRQSTNHDLHPSNPNPTNPNTPHHSGVQRRERQLPSSSYHSAIATLNAEEAAIEQRKLNIQRFGAAWLRPPGVAKTYQQRMDEEAERIEQAEIARREAQMLELQAASEQQGQGVPGMDGTGENGGVEDGAEGEGMQEERDLDADVPDADMADDVDTDGSEDEEDITFNEESLLAGSEAQTLDESRFEAEEDEVAMSQHMIELQEAELDGRLQQERELGIERDLDDDVPEAGSYEHTDSDEELTDSDEDDSIAQIHAHQQRQQQQQSQRRQDIAFAGHPNPQFGMAPPPAARRLGFNVPAVPANSRRSMVSDDGSEPASSSFLSDSPVLARRHGNGNSIRARQQQQRGRLPGS